jgi:hypothetical protein
MILSLKESKNIKNMMTQKVIKVQNLLGVHPSEQTATRELNHIQHHIFRA